MRKIRNFLGYLYRYLVLGISFFEEYASDEGPSGSSSVPLVGLLCETGVIMHKEGMLPNNVIGWEGSRPLNFRDVIKHLDDCYGYLERQRVDDIDNLGHTRHTIIELLSGDNLVFIVFDLKLSLPYAYEDFTLDKLQPITTVLSFAKQSRSCIENYNVAKTLAMKFSTWTITNFRIYADCDQPEEAEDFIQQLVTEMCEYTLTPMSEQSALDHVKGIEDRENGEEEEITEYKDLDPTTGIIKV